MKPSSYRNAALQAKSMLVIDLANNELRTFSFLDTSFCLPRELLMLMEVLNAGALQFAGVRLV